MANWKVAESSEEPLKIDKKSSSYGIYVRKNIEKIVTEDDNGVEIIKYRYQECLMTDNEYNDYLLEKNVICTLLDKDDSDLQEEYDKSLDEPIPYMNGFSYRPRYIENYYTEMKKIVIPLLLVKLLGGEVNNINGFIDKNFLVFDATGLKENAVEMTALEIVNLYFYLYVQKEVLYGQFKEKKAEENE